MKDQEQKCHVCRFCEQSFSNGKKLGGHMRGHLALISAIRNKGTQEFNQEAINVDKGLHVFYDDDRSIKKTQGIDKDYDINGRKQGIQEDHQQVFDGKKADSFHDRGDEMIKSTQQEFDVDQDYCGNVYVLRENPKRSWRVSNSNSNSNSSKDYGNLCKQCGKGFYSSKALAAHRRCHSRKYSSITNSVCEKCGKGFDSLKALYGHMRCHSIKRPRPLDESSVLSSSEEHGDDDDDDDGDHGLANANPVRKKRSCTRYKSPKRINPCTSFSSCGDGNDDEVEQGAICLMMLSRGVRNLERVKMVISNQAEFALSDSRYSKTLEKNLEFEVSVDGSMEFCEVKSKSKLSSKRDLIVESGSGQWKPDRALSTLLKSKSAKKPRSSDDEFGVNRDANDSPDSKGRSKGHSCSVCFKGFGSGQALGRHKRLHNKTESEVTENNHIPDVDRLVNLNLEGGINNGDVGLKLTWVHSNIEWDPLAMLN